MRCTGLTPLGCHAATAAGLRRLAGTAVFVFASSMAVLSAGGSIFSQSGVYPDETARQRNPAGNHLGELGPSGVVYVAAAVGAVAIVLSFLFSRVSGGHFNSAVTLSFMLSKRVSVKRGCFYMLAQFLGSVLGKCVPSLCLHTSARLGAPSRCTHARLAD